MKKLIVIMCLAGLSASAQPKKGDNVILMSGVSYSQVINKMLDAGYDIEKSDSIYKTARTNWKNCPMENGKPSMVYLSIGVRVKDTVTMITGRWYSQMSNMDGNPKPADIYNLEYGGGAKKLLFNELDKFAGSLSPDRSYSVTKQ